MAASAIASAFFALILAFFTWRLIEVGRDQHSAAMGALKLAREEFTASHRPRLVVRNIVTKKVGADAVQDGYLQLIAAEAVVSGQFYVANAGDSKATVTEALFMIYASRNGLPMERPYEGEDGTALVARSVLVPGDATPVIFDATVKVGRNTPANSRYGGGNFRPGEDLPTYAMGWIDYLDDARVRRRVSFCRRYDPNERRFLQLREADPDYETAE